MQVTMSLWKYTSSAYGGNFQESCISLNIFNANANVMLKKVSTGPEKHFSQKQWSPKRCAQKGAFKDFAKFKGKRLFWSLYFNKVADCGPAALLDMQLY